MNLYVKFAIEFAAYFFYTLYVIHFWFYGEWRNVRLD